MDQGTPLVLKENNRHTVIGMFLHQQDKCALYAQLSPEVIDWVHRVSDWTQESNCATLTGCACGIMNEDPTPTRHKRSPSKSKSHQVHQHNNFTIKNFHAGPGRSKERNKFSNSSVNAVDHKNSKSSKLKPHIGNKKKNGKKFPESKVSTNATEKPSVVEYGSDYINAGPDVTYNKYPWMALIMNRLDMSVYPSPANKAWYEQNPPGAGGKYDMCGGALLTNKHVITTADCAITVPYSNVYEIQEAEKMLVKLGYVDKWHGEWLKVKELFPHPDAFKDAETGKNNNLGKLYKSTVIDSHPLSFQLFWS